MKEPYYFTTRFFDVVYHGGKNSAGSPRQKKADRPNQETVLMKQTHSMDWLLSSIPVSPNNFIRFIPKS